MIKSSMILIVTLLSLNSFGEITAFEDGAPMNRKMANDLTKEANEKKVFKAIYYKTLEGECNLDYKFNGNVELIKELNDLGFEVTAHFNVPGENLITWCD